MLKSPAMRYLSLSARRILDRIEIELASHGGKDNGALPVTYADFQAFGIDGHSIRPAINELVAMGLVEIAEQGSGGNETECRPNKYRITYRDRDVKFKDKWPLAQTHEWRHIDSEEKAKALIIEARECVRDRNRRKLKLKNMRTLGGFPPSNGGAPQRRRGKPDGVTPHTTEGKTPHTFLDSRGGGRRTGPPAQGTVTVIRNGEADVEAALDRLKGSRKRAAASR